MTFFHPLDAGTIEGEVATNLAAVLRLTIAVHAGIWGDFREIDSKHMLTLAPAHPAAEFDLFDLGMPSVRDTLVVANSTKSGLPGNTARGETAAGATGLFRVASAVCRSSS